MRAAPPAELPVIALEALRFAWPGQAQDCLNLPAFALAAGEDLFLHGESGSGKSTLLALLAGVLLPHSGAVRLLGQDWNGLSGAQRDRLRVAHIGFIFQQFNLLPYLSVIENVLLPCRFSALRRQRAVAAGGSIEQQAHSLLRQLDLAPALWPRRAAELSVGQQQRVAAARALIGQPELLIADEPTSALDAARQAGFLELLRAECAASGAALLFVSHDQRLAAGFSRVLSLSTLNQAARELVA